jgi:hypothetical protein
MCTLISLESSILLQLETLKLNFMLKVFQLSIIVWSYGGILRIVKQWQDNSWWYTVFNCQIERFCAIMPSHCCNETHENDLSRRTIL